MEYAEEVIKLKSEQARLEADVNNLKGWQKAQNGSIHEIRADLSKMKYWIMGSTFGLVLNLLGVIAIFLKG